MCACFTFQIQTRDGQTTSVPVRWLPSLFEKLQRRRLLARVLRVQVQGVRGLRNLVHEGRRRRGKCAQAVFITVYIIAYTYVIVRTGRVEKMVVDFYPENLGWAGDIGQREPINCKTVGSHPLRGQSRTTNTAAVRLLS